MPTGTWELAKDTVKGFIADEALSHGASIAYYTLFAVAPVLLIIIAIAALCSAGKRPRWPLSPSSAA
jgi:membrane protein